MLPPASDAVNKQKREQPRVSHPAHGASIHPHARLQLDNARRIGHKHERAAPQTPQTPINTIATSKAKTNAAFHLRATTASAIGMARRCDRAAPANATPAKTCRFRSHNHNPAMNQKIAKLISWPLPANSRITSGFHAQISASDLFWPRACNNFTTRQNVAKSKPVKISLTANGCRAKRNSCNNSGGYTHETSR